MSGPPVALTARGVGGQPQRVTPCDSGVNFQEWQSAELLQICHNIFTKELNLILIICNNSQSVNHICSFYPRVSWQPSWKGKKIVQCYLKFSREEMGVTDWTIYVKIIYCLRAGNHRENLRYNTICAYVFLKYYNPMVNWIYTYMHTYNIPTAEFSVL